MKFYIYFSFLSLLLNCSPSPSKSELTLDVLQLLSVKPPEEILFSYPGRDVPEEKKKEVKNTILRLIKEAKVSIDGYFYSFNDLDILITLREAQQKGIKLNLVGDREEEYLEAEKFSLSVRKWNEPGIQHVKVLLFDKTKAFMGTGNFSGHGLIRDNNAYWVWNLKEEEGKRLVDHLDGKQKSGEFKSSAGTLHFAPEAGKQIQDQIVDAIEKARFQIQFLIFTHYDPVISFALLRASQRGVRVEGIYNQPMNPEGQWLSKHLSLPSQIYLEENQDSEIRNGVFYGGLLHHKTLIIDRSQVLVGSYNFTVSARDDNREFFTIFRNPSIVQAFYSEWERVKSISKKVNSSDNPEDMHSYQSTEYQVAGESFFALWRERGTSLTWDKNSSGLSQEFRLSLGHSGASGQPVEGRFTNKPHPLSEFEQVFAVVPPLSTLNFRLNPNFYELNSPNAFQTFLLWDGKSKPKSIQPTIVQNQMSVTHRFPVSFRSELANGQWVIAQGASGNQYFCTVRQGRPMPSFIEYLLQRLERKGGERKECLQLLI